ncbi:DUF4176 domain-containing protein, partial [Staphylococcus aureus]|uniref:DUF4176 domain-containing protein n=1 Tax=Staphylococcus aureus TaxID=1280 RepID=UPI00210DD0B0
METIGSIIYLKEGAQKLMIINRGPIVEIENQKYMFDYSACKYPIGVVEDEILKKLKDPQDVAAETKARSVID